jgi:hypothetical protein
MNIFTYSFVGKSKDWFDSISPGTITNWDLFQDLFTKIFGKKKYHQTLYSQLQSCERNLGEDIKAFNDRFNTLIRCFPQGLRPSKYTILNFYISTMKDLYGILIGRRPTTLFQAQERSCEIE